VRRACSKSLSSERTLQSCREQKESGRHKHAACEREGRAAPVGVWYTCRVVTQDAERRLIDSAGGGGGGGGDDDDDDDSRP
jgi:hypothetical protein